MSQQPHVLYRFYDANDALLYVGITCNPTRRMEKHRGEKPWWTQVARISLEQYGDRQSVLAAERAAIGAERPLHNIRMNGSGSTQPTAVSAPGSLPCGLKVGGAYALGLDDGTCPCVLVLEGDEDGVTVDTFDWWVGMFCNGEQWISADSIVRWAKDELLPKHVAQERGYSAAKVFDMEPLGAFQTNWLKRAKA